MKQHFYLYKGAQKNFEKIAQQKYLLRKKLGALELSDAYVLPPVLYRQAGQGYAKGGVLDSKGIFVHSSGRYRDTEETKQPCTLMGGYEFSKVGIPILSEPCIYCGEYLPHYGHFLCESMTRLWYVVQNYHPGMKLIFISDEPREIGGNFRQIFELLGVDINDVRIVTHVTQCKNLIVPDASSIFCHWYTPEFVIPFKKISSSVKKVYKKEKIYLSRTRFKDRFIIGEENIEKLFAQNGYYVIYPEQLPLSELIAYLKGAKVVAGLSGTALHNIIFARQNTQLIVLNRMNLANPVQEMMNQSRWIATTYVDAHFNYLGSKNTVFLVGLTPPLKRFAQSKKFKIQGVPNLSKHQVELYFKCYMKNFKREAELGGDEPTLRDIWPAVLESLSLPKDEHIFVKLKYFLLSKLFWGKMAEKYRQRYLNIVEK